MSPLPSQIKTARVLQPPRLRLQVANVPSPRRPALERELREWAVAPGLRLREPRAGLSLWACGPFHASGWVGGWGPLIMVFSGAAG